ncbi:hypothetical protein [Vibrio hepatarius]|uniref:hypothetical protein n=1 Tax=Vibrio hepatarius TaxID=171383 RepID=UPI001C08AA28|nr:hypothetical protein [Vibrio hepatarius]MBU2895354.1 hypothetical protein [Vibrio hepatarius]
MSLELSNVACLIKFIDSKYVSSFVDEGLLYMNTLGYFRTYEDENLALRADEHEGLSASLRAGDVDIIKDGRKLDGIIGKVDSREIHVDEFKLYCMTAITFDDLAFPFFLDQSFKNFGDKAVIIEGRHLAHFFERLIARVANDETIYAIDSSLKSAGLIQYVERGESHFKLTPFHKFSNYKWQKEFRLVYEVPQIQGAYELRLGALNDIAGVIDTKELLSTLLRLK